MDLGGKKGTTFFFSFFLFFLFSYFFHAFAGPWAWWVWWVWWVGRGGTVVLKGLGKSWKEKKQLSMYVGRSFPQISSSPGRGRGARLARKRERKKKRPLFLRLDFFFPTFLGFPPSSFFFAPAITYVPALWFARLFNICKRLPSRGGGWRPHHNPKRLIVFGD